MTMLTKRAYALHDTLSEHLDAEQKDIVSALLAIVRLVAERGASASSTRPDAVEQALSALEAWCGGKAEHDVLWAATLSLERSLEPAGSSAEGSSHEDLMVMLLGTLRKAMYEDHEDWPAEVVLSAVEALCRLGEEETGAVQSLSNVLRSHGLL